MCYHASEVIRQSEGERITFNKRKKKNVQFILRSVSDRDK